MKKVIGGEDLRNKMQEAINLLCGTVKQTLGPKGNNVIIDHSTFNPFITNDGVTIALNIESDDAVTNTILELAKEASVKTNDNVGDGTTTTLVLLESIFNLGLKYIKEGINPIIIKKSLTTALNDIISELYKIGRKPNTSHYNLVASISANDEIIGNMISDVYKKIKNKEAIFLKEHDDENTFIIYNKGYSFETIATSPYFLNKEINWENPSILLCNEEINNIEDISEFINYLIKEKRKGIIIAPNYDEVIINEVVSLFLDNIPLILLKTPLYGKRKHDLESDLKTILKGNIGSVLRIKINKENTLIYFKEDKEIKDYIKYLKGLQKEKEEDRDYLDLRIAMFQGGTAEIYIGAPTTTERREKKMRFEDALWALSVTKEGIVVGSGLTLLQISDKINNQEMGYKILKETLTKPMEQILINSGIEPKEIIEKIRNSNYQLIYNVNTNSLENIQETKVIEPLIIVINSLKNACSIASMLLSTSSLVVNEYKNELNKLNPYDEI